MQRAKWILTVGGRISHITDGKGKGGGGKREASGVRRAAIVGGHKLRVDDLRAYAWKSPKSFPSVQFSFLF